MLNSNDAGARNCSLCYRVEIDGKKGLETRFYRIADVVKRQGEYKLIPADSDRSFARQAVRTDWHFFFNHCLYRDPEPSRFCYLNWVVDPDEKPLTWCAAEDESLKLIKSPIVVFTIGKDVGADSLPKILYEGIQLPFEPPENFLLVYQSMNDTLVALNCRMNDFQYQPETGILYLRRYQNSQTSVKYLPVSNIKSDSIFTYREEAVVPRITLCTDWDIDVLDWDMPVRRFADIASDYVLWAQTRLDGSLTRADRQRLRGFVDQALRQPDLLEEYMGEGDAKPYENDVRRLQRAVADMAGESDSISDFVRDALEQDGDFQSRCKQKVLADGSVNIEKLKQEKTLLKTDLEQASKKRVQLNKQLRSEKETLDDLERAIASRRGELSSLDTEISRMKNDSESIYSEFASNLALRLGLRAVASTSPQNSSAVQRDVPHLLPPRELEVHPSTDSTVASCIGRNLHAAGLRVRGASTDFVSRCLGAAVATAIQSGAAIALEASFAGQVADAISYARFGMSAGRVEVPYRCDDSTSLTELMQAEGRSVYLISNVIDSGNEALLAPGLYRDSAALVMHAVSSLQDLKLIAPELWGSCLYLDLRNLYDSYGLIKAMRMIPREKRRVPDVDAEEVEYEIKDIDKISGAETIPLQNKTLLALFRMNLREAGVRGNGIWEATIPQMVLSLQQGESFGGHVGALDKTVGSSAASNFAARVNYAF